MTDLDGWITPKEAKNIMSKRAGYEVSVDDIRQLRRTGKIKQTIILSDRMRLYNRAEIETVKPPDKRRKVVIDTQPDAA